MGMSSIAVLPKMWRHLPTCKGFNQTCLYCLLLTLALDTRWKENTESPAGLAHHSDDNSF